MGFNGSTILGYLRQNLNIPKRLTPIDRIDPKLLTHTILSHTETGRLAKAVAVLFASPIPFDLSLYAHLFHLCASSRAIVEARKLESHLVTFFPIPPVFLLNRAIETYAKCGFLDDSRELFDEMPERDGGSWNAMIKGYAQGGHADDAFALFRIMGRYGIFPNEITFSSVLGCCGTVSDVSFSRQLHGLVVRFGFCENVVVGTSLVDVYGKGGLMCHARRMFDEIPYPNAHSWNVIMRRYFEAGLEKEAVSMFFEMVNTDVPPMNFMVSTALIACSRDSRMKEEGLQIHGFSIKTNFEEDAVVSGSLIHLYCENGDLESAHRVFDLPTSKNLINWNSMVAGYAKIGRKLFNQMPERNVIPWNAMLTGYTGFSQWEEASDMVLRE